MEKIKSLHIPHGMSSSHARLTICIMLTMNFIIFEHALAKDQLQVTLEPLLES